MKMTTAQTAFSILIGWFSLLATVVFVWADDIVPGLVMLGFAIVGFIFLAWMIFNDARVSDATPTPPAEPS